LDEIDFPLTPKEMYSAKEMFDVLNGEKEDYLISIAGNWGQIKKDRTTNKLRAKDINQLLIGGLERSLNDPELYSLELEFIRRGINSNDSYTEIVDFWYECVVENTSKGKRFRVRSYAASQKEQEFIEKNILKIKKDDSRRGITYFPKK